MLPFVGRYFRRSWTSHRTFRLRSASFALAGRPNRIASERTIEACKPFVQRVWDAGLPVLDDLHSQSYNWDTTLYESAQGKDRYPNGEHTISVRCSNDNPAGYDLSEWFNITVVGRNIEFN